MYVRWSDPEIRTRYYGITAHSAAAAECVYANRECMNERMNNEPDNVHRTYTFARASM